MDDYDNLLRICASRKSARVFADRPVPEEFIAKIKKIALTSPYVSGKKNWNIEAVTDAELLQRMKRVVEDRVGDIQGRIRPDMRDDLGAYAHNFTFFASAPLVLVPLYRVAPSLSLMHPDPGAELIQWERDAYVQSISCVSMLILLAARSLGLGACYVTGALIAREPLERLLRLPPGRSIGALIPVGFTDS